MLNFCISCLREATDTNLTSVFEQLSWNDNSWQHNCAADILYSCLNVKIVKRAIPCALCLACLAKLAETCSFKVQPLYNLKCLADRNAPEKDATKLSFNSDNENAKGKVFLAVRQCLLEEKRGENGSVAVENESDDNDNNSYIIDGEIETEGSKKTLKCNIDISKGIEKNEMTEEINGDCKKQLDRERIKDNSDELKSLRRDCMDYYFFKWSSTSKYKCAICNKSFIDVDEFKMHIREHDNEAMELFFRYKTIWELKIDISTMKCRHCGEFVPDLVAFKRHLSQAHNIESKNLFRRIMPYNLNKDEIKCVICNEVFMYVVNLNTHMKVHCGSYTCPHCDKPFTTFIRLKHHVNSIHSRGTFRCNHCEMTFETRAKRNYHVSFKHGIGSRNICQYCPEKFKSFYTKMLHLSKVHNKQLKNYECKSCEEKFVTGGTLSKHVRQVHSQERKHKCLVCGKAFFQKGHLARHMIKHTGEKNFHCSVCHKSYGREFTLKEHMKIHTDEKEYVCQYCGRAFIQKCSLKSHLNIHLSK